MTSRHLARTTPGIVFRPGKPDKPTAAVPPLHKLRADTLAHTLAAHVYAEAGHCTLLDELGTKPLLDLNMWFGEASGAALVLAHRRGDLRRAGVFDRPPEEAAEPKAAVMQLGQLDLAQIDPIATGPSDL